MKVIYFDCFSGISGDMTMGALMDLGVDEELFRKELDKLKLDGYKLVISKSIKNGITGKDVNVILTDDKLDYDDNCHHEDKNVHTPDHDHNDHDHDNALGHHSNNSIHNHSHSHDRHARNLRDIETLIDESDISQKVRDFSKKVFREIAAAEAKVHDKDIYEVHFHEVGAIDSIVDIVGTAIPVPVPAVMEMISKSGIPLVQTDINTELVTPTGMGIIKCLSSGFGNMPQMSVTRVGYGMGKRDTGGFNALRLIMGIIPEDDDYTPNKW